MEERARPGVRRGDARRGGFLRWGCRRAGSKTVVHQRVRDGERGAGRDVWGGPGCPLPVAAKR
jgi:hypothetical protein